MLGTGQTIVNEDASMPVTLKQLAARAHVHPSTISRVANHDPGLRIGAATRQRIEALLRETEYRPNGVARGLKLAQTLALAVVSPERQRSHLQSLHARRVDGVILASSFLKDPTVRWLRQQHVPYVLVNRFSDEDQDPFVGSDDLVGARAATAHLTQLGHRRIGHLAGKPTVSTGVMRRRGYLSALSDAGLTPDPHLIIESGYTEDGGARAAQRLLTLEDRPTALFAVTDMTAVGAFGTARRMGLRIPEDVAIVGYNDIPLATRMVPPLTTVHVPIHDFGAAAARLLLEQIETGERSRRRVIFNPELIVRGS